MFPHLHSKPNNPTRLLHSKQLRRFTLGALAASALVGVSSCIEEVASAAAGIGASGTDSFSTGFGITAAAGEKRKNELQGRKSKTGIIHKNAETMGDRKHEPAGAAVAGNSPSDKGSTLGA